MWIRVAIAQINPIVGDLKGNREKILKNITLAYQNGAHIVTFPELAVTGYPPEDLVLRPEFLENNMKVMTEIAENTPEIVAIFGFINTEEGRTYNAAAVSYGGRLCGVYHKTILPNYGVFDEKRYFRPGGEPIVFSLGPLIFGVNICEDIWFREGPTKLQSLAFASLILNISASPYHVGKMKMREDMLKERAKEYSVFICYTNMVGGQDEIVFDGGSMMVDRDGQIIARARQFEEELLLVDIEIGNLSHLHTRKKYGGIRRIEIEKEIKKKA